MARPRIQGRRTLARALDKQSQPTEEAAEEKPTKEKPPKEKSEDPDPDRQTGARSKK